MQFVANLSPLPCEIPKNQRSLYAFIYDNVCGKAAQFFFILFVALILVGVTLLQAYLLPTLLWQRMQAFVTIFLGIFIEAAPFLVAGALVSGLIAEFMSPDLLQRLSPRHPLLASVAGGLLGLTFPVCECGVVPVTRRLYRKGLPIPTGIAFLLSAPVINPVVIASTYAAYGWSVRDHGALGAGWIVRPTIAAR